MINVRSTRAIVLLALALALWPRAGAAQAVKTYTLDEMQQLAATYYQAVGISRAQVDQAREMERMAFAARLPSITSQGVVTTNVITASLTFNDFKIDIMPRVDYQAVVSAVQPIFTGFRLENGHRQAKLAIEAAHTGLAVTVQDTGEGIPASDLPRIFERFYQVDKSRPHDRRSGIGLGLAIVRQIVEAHGGTIQVASQVGQGTVFSVWLPLPTPEMTAAAARQ